jgi:hypothetical protein
MLENEFVLFATALKSPEKTEAVASRLERF